MLIRSVVAESHGKRKKSTSCKKVSKRLLDWLADFLALGNYNFRTQFPPRSFFKEPVTRLAFQLGLTEESFFFGLETLLAALGLLLGILGLTLLGFLSNYVLGRFFISTTEKFLDKVPFLSTVYRSVKQIVETFGKENRAVFKSVALIEYPRKDCWVLGFVTGDASSDTEGLVGKKLTNVFVPTTPNPTSGFLLLVPREEVHYLDMSVGDGMKMLISGGAVVPPKSKSAEEQSS